MRLSFVLLMVGVMALAIPVAAQETPPEVVASYDALADTILAVKRAEAAFVRSILAGHLHAAAVRMARGDHELAAAEMALFGNEGDNGIGGVRKKLLEGGHHHNAAGEGQGIFEPGYVIVTKVAKTQCLELASKLRQAETATQRQAIFEEFQGVAKGLLGTE